MEEKKEKLGYIKSLDFAVWDREDFYGNINLMKDVIAKYPRDYDFYIEFLKSSEDWDEYVVCDYYDETLKAVVIVDVEVNWDFETEENVLEYLEELKTRCDNMKKKIKWLEKSDQ